MRRHALRLIATYLQTGRHVAVAVERAAWVADSVRTLVEDGYQRETVERQVTGLVSDMLVTIVPPEARRSGVRS